MSDLPAGTVTFLFTDVEGSTRLWEQHPGAMRQALARHDALIEGCVERHGGTIVQPRGEGDSRFAVFPRAGVAVAAASAIQQAFLAEPWPMPTPLRVRIALHSGEGEWHGIHFYGTAVNRCARLRAVAHGGQTLISLATEELVRDRLPEGVELRDLGAHRLKDLQQPEHIFQLLHPALPADFPPLKSLDALPNNLPIQTTPFVGREEELAEIAAWLADPDYRLLTLIGPGGIGKTRLVLQAAAAQIEHFSQGVFYVPMDALSTPEFIAPAIADALNFPLQGQHAPQAQILNYLREKELLLVLDNFEHLLEGADIAADLLQACPRVKILATSREPLSLDEEWVKPVYGFRIPAGAPVNGIEQYSAVRLFLLRARRVRPDFALAEADKSFVVRICQLVGGAPLGIELAAAWVKMLSCAEIAQEIERSLDFLRTSLRNVPGRQRSIRAVFEHSWNLMSEPERRAFRQLAVFRGGFRREAAAQVTGVSLPVLGSLVDKSLLQVTGKGRYERNMLLWQFANEKLEEAPEEKEQVQDRHASYYATFLQQRAPQIKGARQAEAVSEVDEEIENVRSAWHWMIAQGKVAEIGQVLEALALFYEARGWYQEGEEAFGQAVAALEKLVPEPGGGVAAVLGSALARQGMCHYLLGLFDRAAHLLDRGLVLLRRTEAQEELAFALYHRGRVAVRLGEYAQARGLAQESLAIASEIGDRRGVAEALMVLGVVGTSLGEYVEAIKHNQEALRIFREVGDRAEVSRALNNLGFTIRSRGDPAGAMPFLEESLAVGREIGKSGGLAYVLSSLGEVALDLGEQAEASRRFQESLALAREVGDRAVMTHSLGYLGEIASSRGDYSAAIGYFREGLKAAMRGRAEPLAMSVLVWLTGLLAKQGDRERAVELAAFALSHSSTEKEERGKAERLLEQLAAELPEETMAAAKERGQAREFTAVVEEILGEKPG